MIAAAAKKTVDPLEAFKARCEAWSLLSSIGDIGLHDAVDQLQHDAEHSGLVERVGQDHIQEILSAAFLLYREVAS